MAALLNLYHFAYNRRQAFIQGSQSALQVSVFPRSLEERARDLVHLCWKRRDHQMQDLWDKWEAVHLRPCRLSVDVRL